MIKITILNWDKFNPRNDVKNPHWFRVNNTMWISQDIFDLTFEEKWVWISLLSLASQRREGTLELDEKWFCLHSQCSEAALATALDKLTRNGCVTRTLRPRTESVRTRTESVRGRTATEQDTTLQNRTEQNRTEEGSQLEIAANAAPPPSVPDLLDIWNSNCGSLPKAEQMNSERKRHWKQRWNDKPDEGYWVSVVKRLAATPFCTGRNDRGWQSGIDFLLKPRSHLKIVEGQYDSLVPKRKQTFAEVREESHKEMYEKIDRGEL